MNKNDIVYRDQIIDTLKKNMPYAIFDDDGNYTTRGMRLLDVISAVPTAQLQHKRGYWIRHIRTGLGPKLNDTIECSECRIAFSTENMFRRSFCPNCGADMRKDKNDETN